MVFTTSGIKKADKENEEEPRFTGPLNDVTIDEGNDLVLDAPITGNPFPEVSWEKDGVPLQTSDRVLPVCNGKRVNSNF